MFMRSLTIVLLLAFMHLPSSACAVSTHAVDNDAASRDQPGPLVAVGGGSTIRAIRERILESAREVGLGDQPRVLVVPQASSRENAGGGSVEMWRDEHGLDHVTILKIDDRDAARAQIAAADIIWMPGGNQNRLMRVLRETELIEAIRTRHAHGAIVGGTSAGAAVLSGPMITGDADLESIRAQMTELESGLDLWPNAIVDQHFIARRRFNRLLSAVLDNPQMLGIGVDESTAAILHSDGAIEVVGASSVMIIDARAAKADADDQSEMNGHHAATGIVLHVLTDGMRLEVEPND